MNPQTLYVSLIFLLIGAASQSELTTQCSYESSVKVIPNVNGTYMYESLEIPSKFVHTYNYTILDNGTKIDVDNYTRGCICDVRRCLRVCSDNFLQFYMNQNKDDIDFGFTKSIVLSNGSMHEIHLVHDFHHVVGSVCEHIYPLDPERDADLKWTLFENGTLFRHGDNFYLSPDDYCFDVELFEVDNELYFLVNPYNCGLINIPWNMALNAYAMMFSIPFFIITIIFYCCLPYLRNDYGKCFISYLSSLTMSYTLISYLIISRVEFSPTPCKAFGYIVYYTVIAYLTWTCVISYDTWNTFTHVVVESSFARYSIVGWSVPSLMTTLTYLAQISHLDEKLKPGIDDNNCGVNTTRWSACIYFYVPCMLVLIYSFVLYIKVLRYIARNKRNVSAYKDNIKKSQKQRFFLYFRLFTFMGVSWFFDILSYFLKMTMSERKAIFMIPDLFNAFQGIIIFLMFICRQQVWIKVREHFSGRRTREHRIITRCSSLEMISS